MLRNKFQIFSSQPLISVGLAVRVYPNRQPSLQQTTIANKLPLRAPTLQPQLPAAGGVKTPYELLPTPLAHAATLHAASQGHPQSLFVGAQPVPASTGVRPVQQAPSLAGAGHASLSPHIQVPVAAIDQKYAATGKFSVGKVVTYLMLH